MKDWERALVKPHEQINRAVEIIDSRNFGKYKFLSPNRIALVADSERKLLGVITDWDIRKAFLNGVKTNDPVSKIMNRNFSFVNIGLHRDSIFMLMKEKNISQMPILDDDGRIVGLELLEDFSVTNDHCVILMAGGLGTRLGELTKNCPKPLIEVGGQPIIETIIKNFVNSGFKKFYIIVNYLAEKIISKIGDGDRFGAEISYLIEKKRSGTAGGLSLLPEKPTKAFLVMNADVLTKLSITHLFNFHEKTRSLASVCVREFEFQVPYGVAKLKGGLVDRIEEKPTHSFFVNAGIYVFEPDVLDFISPDQPLDMPDLINQIAGKGLKASVFPIREYWMDVGRLEDLSKAKDDFIGEFNDL